MNDEVPNLFQVVLDAEDARGLAEFYRVFLGLEYAPASVPPPPGERDDDDAWLVLTHPDGSRALAIERAERLPRATWPHGPVPQQLHLDLTVPSVEALLRQRDRALALGATQLEDRTSDPDEPLFVFADPAGHPFCIFVGPPR